MSSLLVLVGSVTALPYESNPGSTQLERREGNNVTAFAIWVPIVAVAAVAVCAIVIGCTDNPISKRVSWMQWQKPRARTTLPAAQGPRELTAEQLAGTILANNPNGATNPPRTRRTRRPRRTPSQISTTSLPAYNKEPGEEEVVIFRGPPDMEDAPVTTAIIMPSVSEDGEESGHGRSDSESSRYEPMPNSPNTMPLLHNEESTADNTENTGEHPVRRRTTDVPNANDPEETDLFVSQSSDPPELPRGEAPSYFDVVDLTHEPPETPSAEASSTSHSTPAPASSQPHQAPPSMSNRLSGFRTLLHSIPNRLSMHGHQYSTSHTRVGSGSSVTSSDNSHMHTRDISRTRHRPSQSGSSSLLSLSPFRTLSHPLSPSTGNLNSPSVISLDSISAPLTHTLVRTEFTYPKSGPTPDQLRLISSRESFARFGVPYGPDAIAFAASTSRHDLNVPPPDFETVTRQASNLSSSRGPAGETEATTAATSSAASTNQTQIADEELATPSSPPDSSLNEDPSEPSIAATAASQIPETEPDAPHANAIEDVSGATNSSSARLGPALSVLTRQEREHDSASPPAVAAAKPDDPEQEGQSVSLTGSSLSPVGLAATAVAPSSPAPNVAAASGVTTASHPPSSFAFPSKLAVAAGVYPDRSESRASSFSTMSYATAAESIAPATPRHPQDDSSAEGGSWREDSAPPTPRTKTHVLEPTDVTITPADVPHAQTQKQDKDQLTST